MRRTSTSARSMGGCSSSPRCPLARSVRWPRPAAPAPRGWWSECGRRAGTSAGAGIAPGRESATARVIHRLQRRTGAAPAIAGRVAHRTAASSAPLSAPSVGDNRMSRRQRIIRRRPAPQNAARGLASPEPLQEARIQRFKTQSNVLATRKPAKLNRFPAARS